MLSLLSLVAFHTAFGSGDPGLVLSGSAPVLPHQATLINEYSSVVQPVQLAFQQQIQSLKTQHEEFVSSLAQQQQQQQQQPPPQQPPQPQIQLPQMEADVKATPPPSAPPPASAPAPAIPPTTQPGMRFPPPLDTNFPQWQRALFLLDMCSTACPVLGRD